MRDSRLHFRGWQWFRRLQRGHFIEFRYDFSVSRLFGPVYCQSGPENSSWLEGIRRNATRTAVRELNGRPTDFVSDRLTE